MLILTTGVLLSIGLLVKSTISYQLAASKTIDEVITSKDILEKLDFIISTNSLNLKDLDNNPIFFTIPAVYITGLSLLFLRGSISKLIRKISPSHIFLFGKEIERNIKRRQLLSNIFWVIIIGVIISIVTGVILKNIS